ncbi:MAG: hypothetical protein PHX61_12535 [Alphaproteobacteria bacterium]|nr:hypothetical protein [Alphaproteobacteria bacterium]
MILDFISKFKSAEDLFMRGMCYWFAIILHNRFSDSEIWYEPVANHFVCKIDGVFYDASGVAKSGKYQLWDEYKQIDELEVGRIIRDCIEKR